MTFQAFQPQPNIFLGQGTSFGNGYTERNVNLGYAPAFSQPAPIHYSFPTQPQTVANPQYDKNNPYGLKDNQVVMNEGTPNAMIVGKDAPRGWWGIPRAIFGGIDAVTNKTWLPDTDWDKRGTGRDSYGNLPKPGELGTAPVAVPETIPNPALTNPQQVPNINPGSPVPSTWKGQLGYYGTNMAIGQAGNALSRRMYNQSLDDYYNRALQARQAADAQDVLTSIQMQNTPLGKQKIAGLVQDQRTAAAQANYLRRLGVASMFSQAKKQPGIEPRANMAHSSANVGNWGIQRMG